MKIDNYIKKLRRHDKQLIARAITTIENGDGHSLLRKLFPFTGHAYQIGITGPPGAGKSTLVNAIAKQLLKKNKKVGIIAVDPTSPFSGGALLGDRIRMTDLALHKNVYIRSMASRGSLGGLAGKTKDAVLVLDAAGFDYIIIETIGVGQVELDIAQVCDTAIVVLVPESGDSIQALKAGLLEIADILVVNKGDRDGCDLLLTELKFALELRNQSSGWYFPILRTVATQSEGIGKLTSVIEEHRTFLKKTNFIATRRKAKLVARIHELIEEKIKYHLHKYVLKDDELDNLVGHVYERKLNPYFVANKITKKILKQEQ